MATEFYKVQILVLYQIMIVSASFKLTVDIDYKKGRRTSVLQVFIAHTVFKSFVVQCCDKYFTKKKKKMLEIFLSFLENCSTIFPSFRKND